MFRSLFFYLKIYHQGYIGDKYFENEMLLVNTIGVNKMVKVTHAAISAITSEVQDVIDNGYKPLIRFEMGIG